jgi:hypothetical protein
VSDRHSHWGGRKLEGAVATVAVSLVLMAGLIALFAWSPWEEPSELDWLQAYGAWSQSVEATLAAGEAVTPAACRATFDEAVGDPPAERLAPVADVARESCAAPSPAGWQRSRSEVIRALRDLHAEAVADGAEMPPAAEEPGYAELASPIAGRKVQVYCWPAERWGPFFQQVVALRSDELSLKGVADVEQGRIDLEPGVCSGLQRYVRRDRPIELSFENFTLAESLVVLAHQAEHFASPTASEPERECFAVQQVRPFVRAAGWGPGYQTELALHAWDLGYTQLPPQLRAPECRNGGALDRHPGSDAWP